MIDSVRNFLRLFDDATPAGERSIEKLAEVLDRLLIAYHESQDTAPESDLHPPSYDQKKLRALIVRHFPDFGMYGWSAPEEKPGDEVMMGDAIDDLADIYDELRGVMWLSENSGETDARWQFRFGFQSHWGRHLLNLRSYLHWYLYER